MLRALLRLTLGAFALATLFTVATLALGFLSIDLLNLHAPVPAREEIAVLEAGLISTAPMIWGLSLLGMLLAWSDARGLPLSRILLLAAGCSVILALLFTLEDIPRKAASGLGLMLPVAVVVVCYWATRLLGKHEKQGERKGQTASTSDRG